MWARCFFIDVVARPTNHLALVRDDTGLFEILFFTLPPSNELIAEYYHQTQKTLNKAIKNNEIRLFHHKKQPFRGMVQYHQMNKSTVNILNLSKMAVCRIIICIISIEALTNDNMKAHNKTSVYDLYIFFIEENISDT